MRSWIGGTGVCIVLAGCGGGHDPVASASSDVPAPVLETATPSPSERRATDWRVQATIADRGRLRGWRGAWIDALEQVPAREVAREPALFAPDRSLAGAMPPAGAYRCRTFKLGARSGKGAGNGSGRGPSFVGYGWFACRIEGEAPLVRFVKADGSQRPVGTIYPDTDMRSVFLGTMMLGDEKRPLGYGRDANRDMAGFVERIGTRRWRVVLPYPRFESTLDVIELVPAG